MVQTLSTTRTRGVEAGRGSPVPPLENGDHLKAAEYMRRYAAMPTECDAELIEGIVYMASPVNHRRHGRRHLHAGYWIAHFLAKSPGLDGGDNSTTELDDENRPQPDLFLRIPETAGGKSRETDDGYIEGPAEFVMEIASTSASIDLNAKFAVYLRHGVQEYLVWRTHDGAVDWFINRGDRFERQDDAAVLKSQVLPGLWLDVDGLLSGDLPKLAATVDQGCAETPDRAAFLKRLAGG